jgi:hypothetical protein
MKRNLDSLMILFHRLMLRMLSFFPSHGSEGIKSRLLVKNLTRSTVLATFMEVADNAATRKKGLLGRDSLLPGDGLWIIPCESVHTFWMRFPIDLVYLDRMKNIRKLRSSVPPWRLSGCLRAHSVIELPSGTIYRTQTQTGDILDFSDSPALSDVKSAINHSL